MEKAKAKKVKNKVDVTEHAQECVEYFKGRFTDVERVYVNEKKESTVVILNDGTLGKAKAQPGDKYIVELGLTWAYIKAKEIQSQSKAIVSAQPAPRNGTHSCKFPGCGETFNGIGRAKFCGEHRKAQHRENIQGKKQETSRIMQEAYQAENEAMDILGALFGSDGMAKIFGGNPNK